MYQLCVVLTLAAVYQISLLALLRVTAAAAAAAAALLAAGMNLSSNSGVAVT
jgi:hypothetical protein